MSDFVIFIATDFLKMTQNFAICEFFRAPFPTWAARRPVYLQLRGPCVSPVRKRAPKNSHIADFCVKTKKYVAENIIFSDIRPDRLPTEVTTGHFGC